MSDSFKITLILLSIIFVGCYVEDLSAANILGILPFDLKSHFNFAYPLFLELASRGHNLTVISVLKAEKHPPNFRHIQLETISFRRQKLSNESHDVNMYDVLKSQTDISEIIKIWNMFLNIAEMVMESVQLKEFIANDRTHFDLVIAEDFRFSTMFMFAHKYNAPLVTLMPFGGSHWVNDYMGNSMNLQGVPHELMHYNGKWTLRERLKSVVITFIDIIVKKFYYDNKYNQLAEKYFQNLPKPLPRVDELEKNISLVLMNSHFSMDVVRPQLPNMIEIGGMHIKRPNNLPTDLKEILDNAKDGVIYFSMGTVLLGKYLPKEKRDAFLSVFSQLKQTVLWKWEDDIFPGQIENVIIRKWFPQSDILAHPNVRLFISHAGLLSTQEAVYRGVPIIGIPRFGDQPRNIKKAIAAGFAVELVYSEITEEYINNTINKVLNDPTYRNKAKEISRIINDKPMTAMETAVYWVEYVIRHKGAYHMKSVSAFMPWYQYYLLDVSLIVSLIVLIALYITYKSLLLVVNLIFRNSHNITDLSGHKKHK